MRKRHLAPRSQPHRDLILIVFSIFIQNGAQASSLPIATIHRIDPVEYLSGTTNLQLNTPNFQRFFGV